MSSFFHSINSLQPPPPQALTTQLHVEQESSNPGFPSLSAIDMQGWIVLWCVCSCALSYVY